MIDLVLGDVGEHAIGHVVVGDDVIEVDGHRRVLQLQVIVHRNELERLAELRSQIIGEIRRRAATPSH